MEIDFEAQTPQGNVQFKGNLNKEEVDFLLKFAILSLMARGSLPIAMLGENESEEVPPSDKLN